MHSRVSGVHSEDSVAPPHVLPHAPHRSFAPPGRVLADRLVTIGHVIRGSSERGGWLRVKSQPHGATQTSEHHEPRPNTTTWMRTDCHTKTPHHATSSQKLPPLTTRSKKHQQPPHLVDAGVVDPKQHAEVRRQVRPDSIAGLCDEAVLLAAPRRSVRVGERRGGVGTHPSVGHEHHERPAAVGEVSVSHQGPFREK